MMIRKIKLDEYLKEYGAMSKSERKDYWRRVGEWLADGGKKLLEATDRPMAKAQNIVQLSMKWKEPEVRMFADGARLLSALVNVADTWLPSQLYAKASYRAVRQMCGCLAASVQDSGLHAIARNGAPKGWQGDAISQAARRDLESRRSEYQDLKSENAKGGVVGKRIANADTPSGRIVNPPEQKAQTALTSQLSPLASGTGVPVRPRHIDQYVHLLPEKTQERAAKYGPLMREMGEARVNLLLLVDDPGASSASRESWAKKITKIDGEVKAIREELDREWTKLVEQGRVVVDDLGNARVANIEHSTLNIEHSADANDPQGATVNGQSSTVNENQRKAALLRKWLIDTRYGNGDKREEYQQKWREKYREMVRLGGPKTVTEKVRAAAEHYGIDLVSLEVKSEK